MNLNDHAWAAGLCVSRAPPASAATGVALKGRLGGVLQLCDIGKMWGAVFFLVVAGISHSMYLIRYKQPYVIWHSPDWPVQREIAMGREVARIGKAIPCKA